MAGGIEIGGINNHGDMMTWMLFSFFFFIWISFSAETMVSLVVFFGAILLVLSAVFGFPFVCFLSYVRIVTVYSGGGDGGGGGQYQGKFLFCFLCDMYEYYFAKKCWTCKF